MSDLKCPECHAEAKDITGHEVQGVYDGVLYWICNLCKHAWNRWSTFDGRRREEAQRRVDAWNAGVQAGRAAVRGEAQ